MLMYMPWTMFVLSWYVNIIIFSTNTHSTLDMRPSRTRTVRLVLRCPVFFLLRSLTRIESVHAHKHPHNRVSHEGRTSRLPATTWGDVLRRSTTDTKIIPWAELKAQTKHTMNRISEPRSIRVDTTARVAQTSRDSRLVGCGRANP